MLELEEYPGYVAVSGASDERGILLVARRSSPHLKKVERGGPEDAGGRDKVFHPIEQLVRQELRKKRDRVGVGCKDRFKAFREEMFVLYVGQFAASFVRSLFAEELPSLGTCSTHTVTNSFRKVHDLMLLPPEEGGLRLPHIYRRLFKQFRLGPWHPKAEEWLRLQYGLKPRPGVDAFGGVTGSQSFEPNREEVLLKELGRVQKFIPDFVLEPWEVGPAMAHGLDSVIHARRAGGFAGGSVGLPPSLVLGVPLPGARSVEDVRLERSISFMRKMEPNFSLSSAEMALARSEGLEAVLNLRDGYVPDSASGSSSPGPLVVPASSSVLVEAAGVVPAAVPMVDVRQRFREELAEMKELIPDFVLTPAEALLGMHEGMDAVLSLREKAARTPVVVSLGAALPPSSSGAVSGSPAGLPPAPVLEGVVDSQDPAPAVGTGHGLVVEAPTALPVLGEKIGNDQGTSPALGTNAGVVAPVVGSRGTEREIIRTGPAVGAVPEIVGDVVGGTPAGLLPEAEVGNASMVSGEEISSGDVSHAGFLLGDFVDEPGAILGHDLGETTSGDAFAPGKEIVPVAPIVVPEKPRAIFHKVEFWKNRMEFDPDAVATVCLADADLEACLLAYGKHHLKGDRYTFPKAETLDDLLVEAPAYVPEEVRSRRFPALGKEVGTAPMVSGAETGNTSLVVPGDTTKEDVSVLGDLNGNCSQGDLGDSFPVAVAAHATLEAVPEEVGSDSVRSRLVKRLEELQEQDWVPSSDHQGALRQWRGVWGELRAMGPELAFDFYSEQGVLPAVSPEVKADVLSGKAANFAGSKRKAVKAAAAGNHFVKEPVYFSTLDGDVSMPVVETGVGRGCFVLPEGAKLPLWPSYSVAEVMQAKAPQSNLDLVPRDAGSVREAMLQANVVLMVETALRVKWGEEIPAGYFYRVISEQMVSAAYGLDMRVGWNGMLYLGDQYMAPLQPLLIETRRPPAWAIPDGWVWVRYCGLYPEKWINQSVLGKVEVSSDPRRDLAHALKMTMDFPGMSGAPVSQPPSAMWMAGKSMGMPYENDAAGMGSICTNGLGNFSTSWDNRSVSAAVASAKEKIRKEEAVAAGGRPGPMVAPLPVVWGKVTPADVLSLGWNDSTEKPAIAAVQTQIPSGIFLLSANLEVVPPGDFRDRAVFE